jgi:hypothetical protein
VASLSAFVPEQCCLSHVEEAAARQKDDACHDAEPPKPEPGDACPMDHGVGAACPMHSTKSSDRCAMSNACAGPGQNLVTMFAYLGAIERPVSTTVVLESAPSYLRAFAPPHFRTVTPDSPPPKA